jgi:uncharacterized protein (TIGR02145 family)
MAENLSSNKFSNGDIIPEAKTSEDWYRSELTKTPAWCYFNYDSSYCSIYGKLYNWYAVNDPRGLAPENWHIPTKAEWSVLKINLGQENSFENGKKLKSKNGWENFSEDLICKNCINWNTEYRTKVPCHTCKDTRVIEKIKKSGNGNNITGFTALPGGCNVEGKFLKNGFYGYWWSTTESFLTSSAYYFYLEYKTNIIGNNQSLYKALGMSVRCIY